MLSQGLSTLQEGAVPAPAQAAEPGAPAMPSEILSNMRQKVPIPDNPLRHRVTQVSVMSNTPVVSVS